MGYGVGLGEFVYNDFTKGVKIGVNLKISGENLEAEDDYANTAVSADIGAIYTAVITAEDFMANRGEFKLNKAGVGIVLRNAGASFNGGMTPLTIGAGGYLQMLHAGVKNNRVRISADIDYSSANSINIRGGAEYTQDFRAVNFSLRAGGNFSPSDRLASGFALGGGIGVLSGDMNYKIDYVFMPFVEIGSSHKMGFSVNF